MANREEILTINVGGTKYTTFMKTLTKYKESKLAKLCTDAQGDPRDAEGNLFIDRDGDLFKYVLRFLQTGKLNLPERFSDTDALAVEASYYGLEQLKKEIEQYRRTRAEMIWVYSFEDYGSHETTVQYYVSKNTITHYPKFFNQYNSNAEKKISIPTPVTYSTVSLKQDPIVFFETLAKEGFEQKGSYAGCTLYCKYS